MHRQALCQLFGYLDGFIEPAVRRVPFGASAVNHLEDPVGVVSGGDLVDVEPIDGQRLIDADDHARRLDGLQRAGVD